jgi:hypothetical protein
MQNETLYRMEQQREPIMITIADLISTIIKDLFVPKKITPSEFRRGVRKTKRIIGFSIDRNAWHVGKFQGNITPMKRRTRGVSRTARKQ